MLEASTGTERHRLPGLTRVRVADLDGDGLGISGARSKASCERFVVRRRRPGGAGTVLAGRVRRVGSGMTSEDQVLDLDGDGIGDTLGGSEMVDILDRETNGSHVAMARSGTDGHLIWKTVLDPWDHWSGSKCQDWYYVRALRAPAADLDGDGTADVIVQKLFREGRTLERRDRSKRCHSRFSRVAREPGCGRRRFSFGIGDPRQRGSLGSHLCGRAEERGGSHRAARGLARLARHAAEGARSKACRAWRGCRDATARFSGITYFPRS